MDLAITPEQSSADVEARIARLEKRAKVRRAWAQMLEEQATDIDMQVIDLGLLAGDLADAEELDRNGEVI